MRRTVAGFVLAAAIATPGIVVAALSGENAAAGGGGAGVVSGSARAVPSPPLAAAVRPMVRAVRAALEARGVRLHTVPTAGGAELVQRPTPGVRCPVYVVFQLSRQSLEILLGARSCGTGTAGAGLVTLTYTPRSAGRTIKQAVAGLR